MTKQSFMHPNFVEEIVRGKLMPFFMRMSLPFEKFKPKFDKIFQKIDCPLLSWMLLNNRFYYIMCNGIGSRFAEQTDAVKRLSQEVALIRKYVTQMEQQKKRKRKVGNQLPKKQKMIIRSL